MAAQLEGIGVRVTLSLAILACAAAVAAAPTPAPPSAAGSSDRLDGLLDGFALGGQRGPVRIDADAMEFDYKTKVLTYRGSVIVTQADLKLRSDTLRVMLDIDHPDKPREVVAEGQVQIDNGARWATGGRAVFDQRRGPSAHRRGACCTTARTRSRAIASSSTSTRTAASSRAATSG